MDDRHKPAAKEYVIRPARSPSEIQTATALFREYGDSLGVDLCFQNFEAELAAMPGKYAPPDGELLLAWCSDTAIGSLGLRPLAEPGCCEFKRLYVRPEGRGLGIGKALAQAGIEWAQAAGYTEIRLDTMKTMHAAIALYCELGFVEIAPYNGKALRELRYFGKKLNSSSKTANHRRPSHGV